MAKPAHYLTNKNLLREILLSKEQDRLTRDAEQMFVLLGNKTIKKMRYHNPDDRDDCLQTGLLALFTTWRSFDPAKSSNPFAFYTEVFKRGIAKGYRELFYHKGDKDNEVRMVSLSGSNDGDGLFNL